jgi:TatD DNase family protein
MVHNGYYISVTPDVVYKEKIQRLVQSYPLEKMMIETDGPWPFEGPFSGKRTTTHMMKESIASIAKIKKLPEEDVSEIIFRNTKLFYEL